ncbi:uncharacterized membrane protein (DUF4010 family) [Bradyrhizobium ottawaense]|uniref:hypothetical protein n=1 Tax=Bradyrhizobium ottawaense TaxID=931866 RepID=UPI003518D932
MLRPNDPAQATNPTLPSVSRRFSFAAPQLRERYLIGALSVLTLSVLLAPALPAAAWHVPHFVDSRTWLGVPNAGDVLSNLAFLAMGVWGSERLRAYVLAKLFELGDALIFEATGHVVSGHTLKHLAAALAAWPVISTLRNRSEPAAVRSAVR